MLSSLAQLTSIKLSFYVPTGERGGGGGGGGGGEEEEEEREREFSKKKKKSKSVKNHFIVK